MHSVLIIDDSEEIQNIVIQVLSPLPLFLTCACSIQEAAKKISELHFSIFIIDVVLPDGDGLEFLSKLREQNSYRLTPAIILSSNSEVTSKVTAFSLGADDYITKPFNNLEFKARIGNLLRRLELESSSSESFRSGPFQFETQKQIVRIANQAEPLNLTPIEFRLFYQLARKPEVILSRNQILDRVWGNQVCVTDRTVDSHVYTLRKKLGQLSRCIQAVPREGYRFIVDHQIDL